MFLETDDGFINLDRVRRVVVFPDLKGLSRATFHFDDGTAQTVDGDYEHLMRERGRVVSVPAAPGFEEIIIFEESIAEPRRRPIIAWELDQSMDPRLPKPVSLDDGDVGYMGAIKAPDGRVFDRDERHLVFASEKEWLAYARALREKEDGTPHVLNEEREKSCRNAG